MRTMLGAGLSFLLLVLGAQARPELDDNWEAFKTRYEKNYESSEHEAQKRLAWEANYDFIQEHNAAFSAGFETYSVGENEFNDLTNEEFVSMLNGYQVPAEQEEKQNAVFTPRSTDLPTSVDWRPMGFVTPVKNQKQCGSCWAFSATGSLEAAHFNKTKKLVSLSEQNLVDCSAKEGNHGCFGGLMDFAFQYVKDNNGIDTEESYPYTAVTGKTCKYNATSIGANLTSWVDIKKGSEEDLAAAVAQHGPISVAIDAGHPGFQMYKHGIYYSKLCSSTRLDHGVLAVGYGQGKNAVGMTQKFWIVKNSWGESWGMHGYINMAKDLKNMCGIATAASYPVV
ncbi:cathepsin L1 [Eurytemora carolleeae]|uniref:cathepsin L1 n=1 Tax=Eurytemora carolleeae TaxID=1294199 RepID=UPI000C76951F|nr:cathepsin L1 [Eurytemora carolleeae]|eukprot:XP_023323528.1 cathepsin L1-like [Eurytemora affinis]